MDDLEAFLHSEHSVVRDTHEASSTLLHFEFNGVRFAVPVSVVEAIVGFEKSALVPGAPATLLGLIQLRGKIVSVAADPLGLEAAAVTPQRVIVCRHDGRYVGLPVDHTIGIAEGTLDSGASGAAWVAGEAATLVDVRVLTDRLRAS